MSIQRINGSDTYTLIKNGIKASNLRAQAISNNIANINTKNYKRFNVIFEENLKKSESSFELKRTKEAHFSGGNGYGEIAIEKEKGTSIRADGNNVDLEVEKVNQAANTLKYNALISNINTRFNDLKTVIK